MDNKLILKPLNNDRFYLLTAIFKNKMGRFNMMFMRSFSARMS
jgi:hypothetical protein